MFELESRPVDVGGLKIAIAEAGVGGRPLLLVHGFTGAKEDFADHLDALAADGWWVVAPDHRGHGESDKPVDEADYSFEAMADDVIGVADALGWDTFALLGHSMGGMVVQFVATSVPHRVDRLVLMDTAHGPLSLADDGLVALARQIIAEGGMDALADALASMEAPLDSAAHQRVLDSRPGFADWLDRKLRTTSGAMYTAMLASFGAGEDRLDALRELTMPTLVICGDQDRPFLRPSRAMADVIDGATLVVIPDAGHSPQFENPDAWYTALTSFLTA